MSCPWVNNREKESKEKTVKYVPLRWELKKQFPGYEVKKPNIIIMYEIVGSRSKKVLQRTVKAVLSGTLNITQTFKVDLTDDWLYFATFFLLNLA